MCWKERNSSSDAFCGGACGDVSRAGVGVDVMGGRWARVGVAWPHAGVKYYAVEVVLRVVVVVVMVVVSVLMTLVLV